MVAYLDSLSLDIVSDSGLESDSEDGSGFGLWCLCFFFLGAFSLFVLTFSLCFSSDSALPRFLVINFFLKEPWYSDSFKAAVSTDTWNSVHNTRKLSAQKGASNLTFLQNPNSTGHRSTQLLMFNIDIQNLLH